MNPAESHRAVDPIAALGAAPLDNQTTGWIVFALFFAAALIYIVKGRRP